MPLPPESIKFNNSIWICGFVVRPTRCNAHCGQSQTYLCWLPLRVAGRARCQVVLYMCVLQRLAFCPSVVHASVHRWHVLLCVSLVVFCHPPTLQTTRYGRFSTDAPAWLMAFSQLCASTPLLLKIYQCRAFVLVTRPCWTPGQLVTRSCWSPGHAGHQAGW